MDFGWEQGGSCDGREGQRSQEWRKMLIINNTVSWGEGKERNKSLQYWWIGSSEGSGQMVSHGWCWKTMQWSERGISVMERSENTSPSEWPFWWVGELIQSCSLNEEVRERKQVAKGFNMVSVWKLKWKRMSTGVCWQENGKEGGRSWVGAGWQPDGRGEERRVRCSVAHKGLG